MTHVLLDGNAIDQSPDLYLHTIGRVFAEFGAQTQDSGNISYGVEIGAERYFVKTGGLADDSRPYLKHPERVALLRNAIRLHASCRHNILTPLLRVIESSLGPLLIYHWVPGELLSAPREQREDPTSAYQRFRGLPSYTIERCLDAIFDLHAQLERSGWIASDFYDGCLLYDFSNQRLTVIDLDTYHEGPFRNTMGRMFGSTRFMAPEEFVLDALIDERTTVFVMGRTALLFLSDGTLDPHAFRGSRERLDVVTRACEADPARRFRSMADFREAWQAAQSHHHVSKR